MRVTAIVSQEVNPDAPTASQRRRLERVDEFVAELSAACNVEIPILKGSLDRAPQDGIILVFDAAGLQERPDVAERTVLINADRAFVLKNLEEYSLVAAVEKHRYFLWLTNRSAESGQGVFGRKHIGEMIQATALPGPFTTERYVLLKHAQASNLVTLLAKYLTAFAGSGC